MQELASRYLHLMPDVSTPKDPQVPFYSSVTCEKIAHGAELSTQYWVDNLTSPVRFSTAVEQILLEPGRKSFVEIGPHGSLAGPVRQIFKAANATNAEYTSVLTRGQDSHASLLGALGQLWSANHRLDLGAIFGTDGGTFLADLPLYPWHYEEALWSESRLAREWRLREHPHHDVLGSRVLESTDHSPSWRNLLRPDVVPWVKDHEIAGDVVFPGVGYVAMAGEAVRQLTGPRLHGAAGAHQGGHDPGPGRGGPRGRHADAQDCAYELVRVGLVQLQHLQPPGGRLAEARVGRGPRGQRVGAGAHRA